MMNRFRRTKSRQRNDSFGSNEKNENSRVGNWLVDYFWISSQNTFSPTHLRTQELSGVAKEALTFQANYWP